MFEIVVSFFIILLYIILWLRGKCECNRILKYKVSQYNQELLIFYNYYQNKRNGYFIELGAYDGIDTSNTYFFEKNFNWHGILIEGGEENCKALKKNSIYRNNSIIICSPICNSEFAAFKDDKKLGSIIYSNSSKLHKCNTLKNITSFYKVKKVDLFILDVEGSELEVLQTFNFDVQVSHWMIEWNHLTKVNKNKIIELLSEKGYYLESTFVSPIDKLFSKRN